MGDKHNRITPEPSCKCQPEVLPSAQRQRSLGLAGMGGGCGGGGGKQGQRGRTLPFQGTVRKSDSGLVLRVLEPWAHMRPPPAEPGASSGEWAKEEPLKEISRQTRRLGRGTSEPGEECAGAERGRREGDRASRAAWIPTGATEVSGRISELPGCAPGCGAPLAVELGEIRPRGGQEQEPPHSRASSWEPRLGPQKGEEKEPRVDGLSFSETRW